MSEELLIELKLKKRSAQETFYKIYAQQMFLITFRYVNNELDAGDIVNSSFFKIFRGIENFVYINDQSLLAWMRKIVVNESLFFLRRQVIYAEINALNSALVVSNELPDCALMVEEYYQMIRNLPNDLRTVFNLYAIDGFSHAEIAKLLSIKESSSRVYLTRARKILQEELTNNQIK